MKESSWEANLSWEITFMGFYKSLFGSEKGQDVGLTNEIWSNKLRVSENDNLFLLQ